MPIPEQLPKLPDIRVPLIDPNNPKQMSREWYDFFDNLMSLLERMRREIP